jgi:Tfp pilus assembly protein PilO
MKKILSILPTQSIVYFLICGAGIVAFIFLILIPSQRTSDELDRGIEKLRNQIEEQRILKPVFDTLLKQVKDKNPTALPATRKVKLARGEIEKLTRQLQEMARRHDLKLNELKTDVNSAIGKSGFLQMRIDATGEFMKLRDFIIDLGTIPSLECIEDIEVRAIESSRQFKLKIWLAQK